MVNGHELAALFNDGYTLEELAALTGSEVPAVRARIDRAGYQRVRKYELKPKAEIKARIEKILKNGG